MLLRDGTRIFVTHRFQKTDKPTVVFIHGDGQNHKIWKNLMNYFFDKGHSVLCYDLPGHGLSQPYKDGEYSFSRFIQTLKKVLAANHVKKPLIVGNSLGGMIALKYAAENPHGLTGVVGVSACDMSPTINKPSVKWERMIKQHIEQSRMLFEKQELVDYSEGGLEEKDIFLAGLKSTSPEAVEGNIKAAKVYDIRSKLGRIKVPVLLFRGSKDSIITQEWMERIRDEIKGSRLITINGYGHHVLLQNEEKITEGVIENYSFLMQK